MRSRASCQRQQSLPAQCLLSSLLQVQLYPQAATCYEELLLHQPASIATHVQACPVLDGNTPPLHAAAHPCRADRAH